MLANRTWVDITPLEEFRIVDVAASEPGAANVLTIGETVITAAAYPATAEIVERLGQDYSAEQVQVFGVFVNASLDDILWTIREADLYGPEKGFGIQLHGDEPPELLRDLHQQGLGRSGELLQVLGHVPVVPVMRAFRCSASDSSCGMAPPRMTRSRTPKPRAVSMTPRRSWP